MVYPAKHDSVVAVAASNCLDKPWRKSAKGRAVDITAPGESVWAAVTRESDGQRVFEWKRGNGTSYAVAMTAGACALWLAYHGREKLLAKYGKKSLPSVFKEVLTTHGVRTPPNWRTKEYGAGILDVAGLLKAKLPDTPSAKGMSLLPKGSAGPREPIAEIADFFPGSGVAAVRVALAKQLRAKDVDLDELLAGLGHEVTFHVATNVALRQAVENRLRGVKAKSVKSNEQLMKQGSQSLKTRLGI